MHYTVVRNREYYTEEKRLGTERDLAEIIWNCLMSKRVEAFAVQSYYENMYIRRLNFLDWPEYTDPETYEETVARFMQYQYGMAPKECSHMYFETNLIHEFCQSTITQ